jgi:hypothetical protein
MCRVLYLVPFSSSSSFVIGYVFTLFIRQLILDILCSYGWQESFSIVISICVDFVYVTNSNFVLLQCIVRSRKLIVMLFVFNSKYCIGSLFIEFS